MEKRISIAVIGSKHGNTFLEIYERWSNALSDLSDEPMVYYNEWLNENTLDEIKKLELTGFVITPSSVEVILTHLLLMYKK